MVYIINIRYRIRVRIKVIIKVKVKFWAMTRLGLKGSVWD